MPAADKNYDELKQELRQAKDDLIDAQERIKRIEQVIWGMNPQSMTPDPDAMINILRDIRSKMPDLDAIRTDYNFKAKLKFMIVGNASLAVLIGMGWSFFKFVRPLLVP